MTRACCRNNCHAAGAFTRRSGALQNAGVISDANLGPLLALVTLGVCLGFLPHTSSARIFMGDGERPSGL